MTKIVLSGCESEGDYDVLLSSGCRNILVTYMHIQKKRTNIVKDRRTANKDLWIMVDSGGFTLRMDPDYLKKKGKTLKDYAQSYIDWLYENHKYIDCAANLDLHELDPATCDWCDAELKKLEQETGLPIVYVWHAEYGPGAWDDMCRKHRYVGFNAADRDSGANISAMLAQARRHGVKVHGFAITDVESLGKELYYSCDSTTWIMGAKFGRTMAWTGAEFRQFDGDNKKRRQQYRNYFIQKGINWDLIEADGRGERGPDIRAECLRMNAMAWMDFQKFVTDRVAPRAFWALIEEQKNKIPSIKAASGEEILAFYGTIGYQSDYKDTADLRNELRLIFAFAQRNEKTLARLDDEEVKEWAAYLTSDADVGNESDRDRLIDIARQGALKILLPSVSDKPQARNNSTVMEPSKPLPKERDNENIEEELTEAEDVDIEVPMSVENVNNTAVEGDNTNSFNQGSEDNREKAPQAETLDEDAEKPAISLPYPDFIQGLADETLRLRARLMVDAGIRTNNLKSKYIVARVRRAKKPDLKRVKSEYKAAKSEMDYLSKQLPMETRKAITDWLDKNKPELPAHDPSLSPDQEKSRTLTTEKAREIGKLGGAPKGNANAFKHGMYTKRLPKLICDTCPIAGQCYMNRPGHVCAFDKEFSKLKVFTVEEAEEAMIGLVNTDLERLQRQIVFETVQGGVANSDVTALQASVFARVDRVKQLMEERRRKEQAMEDTQERIMHGTTTITEKTERTVTGPMAALGSLLSTLSTKNRGSNKPQEDDKMREAEANIIDNTKEAQ